MQVITGNTEQLLKDLWSKGKTIRSYFAVDLDWNVKELDGKFYTVCFGAGYIYELTEDEAKGAS